MFPVCRNMMCKGGRGIGGSYARGNRMLKRPFSYSVDDDIDFGDGLEGVNYQDMPTLGGGGRGGGEIQETSFDDNFEEAHKSDFIREQVPKSIVAQCITISEKCKRGLWVDIEEWARPAFEEQLEDCDKLNQGWELISLPPDPRLKLDKDDEFYEHMQKAATVIGNNAYYSPQRKVQMLQEMYYNLRMAKRKLREDPELWDYMGYKNTVQINKIMRIPQSPWIKFMKASPKETFEDPLWDEPLVEEEEEDDDKVPVKSEKKKKKKKVKEVAKKK